MTIFRFFTPLTSAALLFLLPSCGLISETGPLKKKILAEDQPFQIVEVKSQADVPRKGRVYGSYQTPPKVKGQGYSDKVRARDMLDFVITDLSEHSPFHSGGGAYKFGPVEVPAEGRVDIPYVGQIQAIGLTLPELSDRLTEKLKPVSNTAHAAVGRSNRIERVASVLGTVKTPGPVELSREGLSSLDLLAAAGGPTQADHLALYSLRRNGREYRFDYEGFRSHPFVVEDGDILSVSVDASNRFHIMGAINKPTSIEFPVPDPNLADAMGTALGLNETRSDPTGVFVFRRGNPDKVYVFNMKEPGTMFLLSRFPMMGEDIVYVTEAPLTRWNRMLSQIFPSMVPQLINNAQRFSN